MFPDQFCRDAQVVLLDAFDCLSNEKLHLLEKYMIHELAQNFRVGHDSLADNDASVQFILHEIPLVSVEGFHFTYGPFPPPEGYVSQDWLDLTTYIIPQEDSEFSDFNRQKEITEKAAKQGCFIRLDTKVECDIEFILRKKSSDLILMRDRKRSLNVSFLSPHFSPRDDIFDLQDDGSWKLLWDWKILDIDNVGGNQYNLIKAISK